MVQGRHQAERGVGAQRVELEEAPPPVRRYPVLATHTPLPAEASLEFARALTQDLIARFLAGELDRVEIMYTQFVSTLRRPYSNKQP